MTGYHKNLLTGMKIDSNKDINKAEVYHKKSLSPANSSISGTQKVQHVLPRKMYSMKCSDERIKETILPADDQNMLAEKYNDEKLVAFDCWN